jgi:hypothetical protein
VVDFAGIGPPAETPLASTTVQLATPNGDAFRAGCASPCDVPRVPFKPAVAELSISGLAQASTARLEIEPSSANLKWWGVLSATSAAGDVQLFETSDLR